MNFAIPKSLYPWNIVLHPRFGQFFIVGLATIYVARRHSEGPSLFKCTLIEWQRSMPASTSVRNLSSYNYLLDIYFPLIFQICLFLGSWYLYHNLVYKQIGKNIRDLKAWAYLAGALLMLYLGSYVYYHFTRVIEYHLYSDSITGIKIKHLYQIYSKYILIREVTGLSILLILFEFPAQYFEYLTVKALNPSERPRKILYRTLQILFLFLFVIIILNIRHCEGAPHWVSGNAGGSRTKIVDDFIYSWWYWLYDTGCGPSGFFRRTYLMTAGCLIVTFFYYKFFLQVIFLSNTKYGQQAKVLLLIIPGILSLAGYIFILRIDPENLFNAPFRHETTEHLIYIAGTCAVVAIFVASVSGIRLLKLQIKLAKKTHELYFLRSQIDPHFLFNCLNNIYSLTLEEKSRKASGAILKLSDMMRFMLEENTRDKISLHEEITYLGNYIALQRMRIVESHDIEFQIYLQDSSPGEEIYIAPMLLQPLVENAFKHGISFKAPSWVHVSLTCDKTLLRFSVTNSLHTNQAPDSETKRSGFGLENVRERLKLIYPKRSELVTENSETYFSVIVTLQLS